MSKRDQEFERVVAYIRAHAAEFRRENYSIRRAFELHGKAAGVGWDRWRVAKAAARCEWNGYERQEAKPKVTHERKPKWEPPPMPSSWRDPVAWRKLCKLIEPLLPGVDVTPYPTSLIRYPAGTIRPHELLVRDVLAAYGEFGPAGIWRMKEQSDGKA